MNEKNQRRFFKFLAGLLSLAMIVSLAIYLTSAKSPEHVNTFQNLNGTEVIRHDTAENQFVELVSGGVRLVRASGSTGALLLLDKAISTADGAVSVKFSGKAYEAAAVFRYKDDNNYMRVTVNWNNALLHISQWINGEGANLTGGGVAITEKTDAELLVTFTGTTVEVWWGGEQVAAVSDAGVTAAGYCGVANCGNTSMSDGSFIVSKLTVTTDGSSVTPETSASETNVPETNAPEIKPVDSSPDVEYTNEMSAVTGLELVKIGDSVSSISKSKNGVAFSREQGTQRSLVIDKNSPYAAHGKASVTVSGAAYEAGVVFRYVDSQNYSYAFANWNGEYVHVRQVKDGEEIEIATLVHIDYADGWKLEVDYQSRSYAVNFNGKTVWAGEVEATDPVAGYVGAINNGNSSMAGYDGTYTIKELKYQGKEAYLADPSETAGQGDTPPETSKPQTPAVTESNGAVNYNNKMSSLSGLKLVKLGDSVSEISKTQKGVAFSREQGTARSLVIDKHSPRAVNGKASVTVSGAAYEAGVVFRYVNEKNYCYAFLNWNGEYIHVRQVKNGEEIEIATLVHATYADNWILEVDYQGRQYAVNFNHQTIWAGEAEATEPVAGYVGAINNGDSSMAGYNGTFVISGIQYRGMASDLSADTGDTLVILLGGSVAALVGITVCATVSRKKKAK